MPNNELFPKDTNPEGACFFRRRRVVKKRGKEFIRTTYEPNEAMAEVHAKFRALLRERIGKPSVAFKSAIACVDGFNPDRFWQQVVNLRYVAKIDIFNAFGQTSFSKFVDILTKVMPHMGSRREVEKIVCRYYANERHGLYYGANNSPDFFNLVCEHLIDREVRKVLRGCVLYFRYVDDLLLFSDNGDAVRLAVGVVREVLKKAGFLENHWKTVIADRRVRPVVVLGRILGCIGPSLNYSEREHRRGGHYKIPEVRVRVKRERLDGGYPRRVIGLSREYLENLEIEVFRARSGLPVERPWKLVGRMIWFVESIFPKNRKLSRLERKIICHYRAWATSRGDLPTGFLLKLKDPVNWR